MYPKEHVLFTALFCIILFLLFPIQLFDLLIIFLVAIFIDVDHYIGYSFSQKSLNLKKAYLHCKSYGIKYRSLPLKERKKINYRKGIFHGFEWLILIFILSMYYEVFIFIFIGLAFHFFLDALYMIYKEDYNFGCLSFYSQYLMPSNKLTMEKYLKNEENKKA